jgi:Cu+-exporting ATPase
MATAIDPVCHMEVDTQDPPGGTFEHDGTLYFFCSPGCREDFGADPASFLAGS